MDFDAPVEPTSRRKRRRSRLKFPEEASFSGKNFRLLQLENPCLLCAFTSGTAAVLVSPLHVFAFLHAERFAVLCDISS
jgi:hypothetical protein